VPLISVVAPVHNESANILEFYTRVKIVFQNLDLNYEIIFVDDGSQDQSFEIIRDLTTQDFHVRAIRLSRNFGHQNAVTCGLRKALGDGIVIIDTDLQDPPELIPDLIEKWNQGFLNVYAKRLSRKGEGFFKKFSSVIFYKFLNLLSEHPIPVNTGDFRLIDRKLLDSLMQMNEETRFLRGMIAWLGYPTTFVEFHRDKRFAGHTGYSLAKMTKLALNAIFSFSAKPLKLASYMGVIGVVMSILFAIYVIFAKVMFPENSLPGYSTLIIAITLMGSLQLFSIGLLGEYLQRVFVEVKERPLYVVQEQINLDQ
jgi:glycosyltransferase involved in cell wall biosynthesis